MAYLKYYYPKIFLKNILSNVMGSSSDTKKYIYEAKLNNIKILSPDINISTENYEVSNEGIIYPFAGIKNVGLTAIQTILKARSEGKFKDVFDFAKRTYGKSINRKTLESLIMAGCFDSFNLNKKTLYMNLDAIINYSEIGELLDEESLKPIIKKYDEYLVCRKKMHPQRSAFDNNTFIAQKLFLKTNFNTHNVCHYSPQRQYLCRICSLSPCLVRF